MKYLIAITLSLLLSAVVAAQEADDRKSADFVQLNPKVLAGFFQKHCVSCHGAKKQEGDLRLDTLNRELSTSAAAERWQEVLDALNRGEMPPEDKPRPANVELEPVLEHLTDSLLLAKKRLSETGGEVMLRRINRREYRNTMEDLFGLRVPDELIPPDDIILVLTDDQGYGDLACHGHEAERKASKAKRKAEIKADPAVERAVTAYIETTKQLGTLLDGVTDRASAKAALPKALELVKKWETQSKTINDFGPGAGPSVVKHEKELKKTMGALGAAWLRLSNNQETSEPLKEILEKIGKSWADA